MHNYGRILKVGIVLFLCSICVIGYILWRSQITKEKQAIMSQYAIFCRAIRDGRADDAYEIMSSNYKQNNAIGEFAQEFAFASDYSPSGEDVEIACWGRTATLYSDKNSEGWYVGPAYKWEKSGGIWYMTGEYNWFVD